MYELCRKQTFVYLHGCLTNLDLAWDPGKSGIKNYNYSSLGLESISSVQNLASGFHQHYNGTAYKAKHQGCHLLFFHGKQVIQVTNQSALTEVLSSSK